MRRALLAGLVVAGPLLWLRGRRGTRGERVTLHYDDGSAVTLEPGAPDAGRLLSLARSAL